MPRNSDIPPESFAEILDWLSPDRELAANAYLDLRGRLSKIFGWNRSADPEGMTDEVFDRVARQVHDVRLTFEGDPKLFFYGVARNLIREYRNKIGSHVAIDDVEIPVEASQGIEPDEDHLADCLEGCLEKLTPERRELILGYYAMEKQAKIDHRIRMAKHLGMSVETLRVRAYRIRGALEKCIENCLNPAGKGVTD